MNRNQALILTSLALGAGVPEMSIDDLAKQLRAMERWDQTVKVRWDRNGFPKRVEITLKGRMLIVEKIAKVVAP